MTNIISKNDDSSLEFIIIGFIPKLGLIDHPIIQKIIAELRIMGFSSNDYQLYFEQIEGRVIGIEIRFIRSISIPTQLPSQIFKISTLNILRVTNLKVLSPEIVKLKELRLLELVRFQQEILPSFISELPNLEVLIITRSEIKFIPKEIFLHKKIRDLDLISNKILYVPQELQLLESLEYLSLEGFSDNAKSLSQCLFSLPRLQKLSLGKFKQTIFPKIWDCLTELSSLTYLTIFGYPSTASELTYVPPTINNLMNLESLWIDGGIKCFPDIPDMKNLQELYLFATPLNNNAKGILNTKIGVCINSECEIHNYYQ